MIISLISLWGRRAEEKINIVTYIIRHMDVLRTVLSVSGATSGDNTDVNVNPWLSNDVAISFAYSKRAITPNGTFTLPIASTGGGTVSEAV